MSSSWNCGPLREQDGPRVPFHVSSDAYLVLPQISHPHLMRQPLGDANFLIHAFLQPTTSWNSNCIQMNARPCGYIFICWWTLASILCWIFFYFFTPWLQVLRHRHTFLITVLCNICSRGAWKSEVFPRRLVKLCSLLWDYLATFIFHDFVTHII